MKPPASTPAMFPGLVGELVDLFGPHTEASPVAIAGQFLVASANATGREPHFHIGETRHGLNENLLVVGQTSRARKGDSRGCALRPFELADPEWYGACVASGLSTGEGLIHAVRDPAQKMQDGEPVLVDEGVSDKRLLVVESEFAAVLKHFRRDANILSDTIRDAWDGRPKLRVMTRSTPIVATHAHISIVGHCTPTDLTRYLSDTETANGLANRFMLVLVDRAQLLPDPGRADRTAVERLSATVRDRLDRARTLGTLKRTARCREAWCRIYPDLSRALPGLVGDMLARSEAHVARLSAIFAVLDGSARVDLPHLASALAWWDYIEASTRMIFAGRTGNDVADRIREGLAVGQTMTATAIREEIFGGHLPAAKLKDALTLLESLGDVVVAKGETNGRPRVNVTRCAPAGHADAAEKEEKTEKPSSKTTFSSFSPFSSEAGAS